MRYPLSILKVVPVLLCALTQNSLAENEKILKLDPNNQDAKTRKQRLEQKIAERTPLTPPPRTPTASPAHSPAGKKKP